MSIWNKIKISDIDITQQQDGCYFSDRFGLFDRIHNINIMPQYTVEGKFVHVYELVNATDSVPARGRSTIEEVLSTEYFVSPYKAEYIENDLIQKDIKERRICKKIIPSQYEVNIAVISANTVNQDSNISRHCITVDRKSLEDLYVWYSGSNDNIMMHAVYMHLSIGDRCYYQGKGRCEVVKIFDLNYMSKDYMLIMQDMDGKNFPVAYGDSNLFHLPYGSISCTDETSIFNDTIGEVHLQPMAHVTSNGAINVIWQPINNATTYSVKVYRLTNVTGMKGLYYLKNYIADSMSNIVIIDNIETEGIVVAVTAEDCDGNTIAKSRGIDIVNDSRPKWW